MTHIKLIWTIIFFAKVASINSQNNLDNIWLLGTPPNDSTKKYGGTKIDFNTAPATFSFFQTPVFFIANASVCDTGGRLLFYTNGCQILNRNHELMENGDGINPGFMHNQWCVENELGYPSHQGILILPFPGSNALYVVVHYRSSDVEHDHKELLYTLVDMNLDGGLGAVILKNQLVYEHAFFASNLTAVRHGNGRDWWIIAPKRKSNRYFKFLLSPEGFSGPFIQDFGKSWTNVQGGSQACFSPDGAKYIRMAPFDTGCQVADFDRCSGTLSHALNLYFPGDTIYSNGCAVSPNNRFLYVSAYRKMYQFDLQAADISASRVLLDTWDGTQAPLSARFFQAMLAPDGKIYLTSPNGVWVMHVIHHPNKKGLACNFEQHGIELPTQIFFPIPNFPHYRLYDLPGSVCDTLGIDTPVPANEPFRKTGVSLRIFPNPVGAREALRIEAGELFDPNDRLFVFNALGALCLERTLPAGQSHLVWPAGTLPAGMYFIVLQRAGGWQQSGKIIVGRD